MTKEEFVQAAREFLWDRIGEQSKEIEPDTDLIKSGIMDSLMLLEFFFFLEEKKGSALEASAVTNEALSSLENAYSLVAGS